MTSILKVDSLQDSGGNTILSSDGAGTITTSAGLNTAITNAGIGITQADQWRLTADIVNAGSADITANLERVDDATFAKIGTGMTESSGIFTFPSTGLYLVSTNVWFDSKGSDAIGFITMSASSDTGSTFDPLAQAFGGNSNTNGITVSASNQAFVNVTNISTFQVKFSLSSLTNIDVKGSTVVNLTCFTFIRLGDSQ